MQKVKKKVIIIVIVCLIVLISALIGDRILGKSYLIKLDYDEVMEKIDNKEDFVLIISKTSCTYCDEYKPKIEKIANEYKIEIYYIEQDLFSKEETDKFKSYVSISGTPTTVFFEDGEEKTAANRINGNAGSERILAKLKSNGFID